MSVAADHYAILGVAPNAHATVIRAAYLALMREYHPDRNPSAAAADKAQAIIAAYKVLGDFDRRSEYDWARRRAREAAEAAAARPTRKVSTLSMTLAGIGLAAAAALMLMPSPTPLPAPTPRPVAAKAPDTRVPEVRVAETRRVPIKQTPPTPVRQPPVKPRLAEAVPPAPAAPASAPFATLRPKPVARPAPVKVATAEPARSEPKKVERRSPQTRPATRQAAVARPAPVARPVPRVALADRRPTKPVVRQVGADRPATTDLASLDQFAMNFYGQSWRFGDAPKRAVLERTRASFVAKRGACDGEACKRDATLKLMRDVSSIVESGQPNNR